MRQYWKLHLRFLEYCTWIILYIMANIFHEQIKIIIWTNDFTKNIAKEKNMRGIKRTNRLYQIVFHLESSNDEKIYFKMITYFHVNHFAILSILFLINFQTNQAPPALSLIKTCRLLWKVKVSYLRIRLK